MSGQHRRSPSFLPILLRALVGPLFCFLLLAAYTVPSYVAFDRVDWPPAHSETKAPTGTATGTTSGGCARTCQDGPRRPQ